MLGENDSGEDELSLQATTLAMLGFSFRNPFLAMIVVLVEDELRLSELHGFCNAFVAMFVVLEDDELRLSELHGFGTPFLGATWVSQPFPSHDRGTVRVAWLLQRFRSHVRGNRS